MNKSSQERMAPCRYIDENSCGISVLRWLIAELGLRKRTTAWLSATANLNKPLLKKCGIDATGVLPWDMISALQMIGCNIEDAFIRWRNLTPIPPRIKRCNKNERLVIAFKPVCGWHWVGARNLNGKMTVADNLETYSWKDLSGTAGVQFWIKVSA